MSVKTRSGTALSGADLGALAAKAEAGFDPLRWIPRARSEGKTVSLVQRELLQVNGRRG